MEIYEFKVINKDEAIKKAENELGIDQEALIIEEVETEAKHKTMFSILDKEKATIKVQINEEKADKNRFNVEDVKNAKEKIVEFLELLVNIYKESDFKFDIKTSGRKIYVNITSDENPKWIGREGHTLEELQKFLKNIIASFKNIKVYADIAEYKEIRERKLIKQAEYGLAHVMKHGMPFALQPMNSYQRRIIHAYLQKENVKTKSEGKEPNRYIVIKPKNGEQ